MKTIILAFGIILTRSVVLAEVETPLKQLTKEIFSHVEKPYIEFTFDYHQNSRADDPKGEEKPICKAHVRSTFSPFSGEKLRVDFQPLTLLGGGAESQYTKVIFNGEYWVTAMEKLGPPGDEGFTRSAVFSAESPLIVGQTHALAGEYFFLDRMLIPYHAKFALLKDVMLSTPEAFTVRKESDGQRIVISLDDQCTKRSFYIDPIHGYSLVKATIDRGYCDPDEPHLIETVSIEDLKEVAPALWVPTAAKREIFSGTTRLTIEEIKLTEVKILKDVDEAKIFSIPIGKDWLIDDKRFGVKFTVEDQEKGN